MIRIEPAVYERVARIAKKTKTSKQAIVNDFLTVALDDYEAKIHSIIEQMRGK